MTDRQTEKATYSEPAFTPPKNFSQTVKFYKSPDQSIDNYCKQLIVISDRQFLGAQAPFKNPVDKKNTKFQNAITCSLLV